jgi:hypothetical protein
MVSKKLLYDTETHTRWNGAESRHRHVLHCTRSEAIVRDTRERGRCVPWHFNRVVRTWEGSAIRTSARDADRSHGGTPASLLLVCVHTACTAFQRRHEELLYRKAVLCRLQLLWRSAGHRFFSRIP